MRTSTHAIDVLSFGRTYINLEGEQIGSSLKNMNTFSKTMGGTCALVSIGLARLGRTAGLLSKIGCDPLGDYIQDSLRAENVDTTLLLSHPQHPTAVSLQGTFLVTSPTVLDLQDYEIDPGLIGHANILFLTDELFRDETSERAARKAMIAAKNNHTKIILLLEALPPLAVLQTILPLCDVILSHEKHDMIAGAILLPFPAHRSAAYIASFIHAWLNDFCIDNACQQAEQAMMLADSTHPSLGLPTQKILDYIQAHAAEPLHTFIQTPYFKHLQYVSTRTIHTPAQCLLHFGYHSQWQTLGARFNVSDAMIQHAKTLLAQSVLSSDLLPMGIICDECPPETLLRMPIPAAGMMTRTVEQAHHVPLQFANSPDISYTLLKWPSQHIAKVSMTYHPDDRHAVRVQQETMLLSLYRACRDTGHALLIEILPPTNSLITATTLAHIMQRFYSLGIYPDWWQFAAPRDQRCWDSIERVIRDHDPDCLGIFVHTPLTSPDAIHLLLEQLAKQPLCKGLVFGLGWVQAILEQWLSQKIADHLFIEQIQSLLQHTLTLWHQPARQEVTLA